MEVAGPLQEIICHSSIENESKDCEAGVRFGVLRIVLCVQHLKLETCKLPLTILFSL